MDYTILPSVNAFLNLCATIFLWRGFQFVKQRNIHEHRKMMISAMVTSAIFLTSYVSYHTLRQLDTGVGHTVFPDIPGLKQVYYAILIPHVILAIVVLPFILYSFWQGLKSETGIHADRVAKHRKIAKYTFPVWLFVASSGVVVYLLLYWIAPALR
jgi:putative membrane protein